MTARLDGFATAGQMLAALRARAVSAVELLDLHLEDRTPIRFAVLLERELGYGFRPPPGFD
jgi:hypothetical protein